jgi:hypothetical protein
MYGHLKFDVTVSEQGWVIVHPTGEAIITHADD